jgi:hypothetical protein
MDILNNRELVQKPCAAFWCANSPHAAFYFFRSGSQRVLFDTPSDAPEQKKYSTVCGFGHRMRLLCKLSNIIFPPTTRLELFAHGATTGADVSLRSNSIRAHLERPSLFTETVRSIRPRRLPWSYSYFHIATYFDVEFTKKRQPPALFSLQSQPTDTTAFGQILEVVLSPPRHKQSQTLTVTEAPRSAAFTLSPRH